MDKIIRVVIENGDVQHVEVPEDVIVVVCNYDVANRDPRHLERDGNGDQFAETIWATGDIDILAGI